MTPRFQDAIVHAEEGLVEDVIHSSLESSNVVLNHNTDRRPHVVIVGGGLAGLTAARQLLSQDSNQNIRITLVEAQDRLGGRVCANTTFCEGYPLDIGAEFIHCVDTLLTKTIADLNYVLPSDWEEYFVTAHADGGPDEHPTRDGKYGMYYVDGQLLMYNDETLKPLSNALEAMKEAHGRHDPSLSFEDGLRSHGLSPSLLRLAVSGYGNTAGHTNLKQLSLHMMTSFEHHWDTNQTDGDFRLPNTLGMTSVINGVTRELEQHSNIEFCLNWPVERIHHDISNATVSVYGLNGQEILADAVICTVPPPLLPKVLPDLLTTEQQECLQYIGFETACKVVLKFRDRPWPAYLQNVICADGGPLPEMWFRQFGDAYLMVGFLMSELADDFLVSIQKEQHKDDERTPNERAAARCLAQLSKILSIPIEDLNDVHVDTLVHAWTAENKPYTPGGYMHPKPGMTTLDPLGEPCRGGRVVLAGEATNTNACGTVQAAMETGVRAAQQVLDIIRPISCDSIPVLVNVDALDVTSKQHQHASMAEEKKEENEPTLILQPLDY